MMRLDDVDNRWRQLTEEVISGMKEWRMQHPRATFREIEAALDERLARVRARMLEDVILVSRAAEWEDKVGDGPRCPECGAALKGRGKQRRGLTTLYEQTIRLEREYGVCPQCGRGFFPPG